LPPTRRTRRLLRGVIGTFAVRVRSVLPTSRARKLRARLVVDLRSRLYSVRRTRTRTQYDSLYNKLVVRGGAELRRSLIRRLRANRRNVKAPVRARRNRRSRPIAVRTARLQRANLRVRRAVQRQYSPVALSPASRGMKL
jgi:hypothetical protein